MPRTFLARTQETQVKVLEGQEYSHTSSFTKNVITTFFRPITPTNAKIQSRATQMGSRPGHNKDFETDRAIAICRARRP